MKKINSLFKFIYTNRVTFLVGIIILLAAYLRLYKVSEYMTFLGDEGRDLLEVRKILSGNLVFLGPRSSAADFYYGPIYFYFITPFLWVFNYDPVGPAVFIALLGVATVYLVYYVGKKLINEKAGIFAAALYTVSPVVIAYSRSSWNPNPLPFVSLFMLYMAYLAVKENSWKKYLIVGVLMGIAIQLQYITLFLGAILFLFVTFGIFLMKKFRNVKFYFRNYLIILSGFILGWSPFLAFELKHGFPNLKTIINFLFFSSKDAGYYPNTGFIINIQTVFIKLFGRLVMRFPNLNEINLKENQEMLIVYILTLVLAFSAVFLIYKIKNKLTLLLFSIWFFVGVLLFGFYKKEIYDYYLGFLFPLPFLLTGNLLSIIYENKYLKNFGKILALIIFSVIFIYNYQGNPFKYVPNKQKEQVKNISEFVLEKTENKPYNFALITSGNSDHAYRYYFEINNQPPTEILNSTIDPKRESVTDQLLVICEDPECKPLGHGLWEIAGFGRAEIAGEWRISVVKVLRLVHYKE